MCLHKRASYLHNVSDSAARFLTSKHLRLYCFTNFSCTMALWFSLRSMEASSCCSRSIVTCDLMQCSSSSRARDSKSYMSSVLLRHCSQDSLGLWYTPLTARSFTDDSFITSRISLYLCSSCWDSRWIITSYSWILALQRASCTLSYWLSLRLFIILFSWNCTSNEWLSAFLSCGLTEIELPTSFASLIVTLGWLGLGSESTERCCSSLMLSA
jgi:hypothetical protein